MCMLSTLEQLTSAKSKLQILLTKSINDDTLIQALTIELAAAKQVILFKLHTIIKLL